MRAYITSIGETTTEISEWALKRLGFDTIVINDPSSLWQKIYQITSNEEDDFLRVDADIIVNQNVLDLIKETELWWYQTLTFDWWKQDVTHGGVQFIRKQCLPIIRQHIHEATHKERPESYLFRLPEFHEPRVCGTYEQICGLNGYKQNNMQRVRDTKERRGQIGYDWELAGRLNLL